MANELAVMNKIEAALVQGDLSKLTPEERVRYYQETCHSLGLNQLTKPFEYITLNGKLTLYARRDATDQLRKVHSVSIEITNREVIDGIYIVTAKAKDGSGRVDESTGAVSIEGLKGEHKANAMLKAETKAKRRVTLSLCGLGILDETEIESIPAEEKTVAPPQKSQLPNPIKELRQTHAVVPSEYVCSFGKYKGKKLSEIDIHELNSYVEYIQRDTLEKGKEIRGQVLEFMTRAGELIESRSPQQEKSWQDENIPF